MKLIHDDNAEVDANRYRNIVAALDNLIVQLGPNACITEFNIRLRAARDVYEHEMVWHMGRPIVPPPLRERDFFDGHHSRDTR